jgi:hypothetical protein
LSLTSRRWREAKVDVLQRSRCVIERAELCGQTLSNILTEKDPVPDIFKKTYLPVPYFMKGKI